MLKPGKPGFFFDVSLVVVLVCAVISNIIVPLQLITQRRVFHLMALKDSDRIQWVEKIRFLCSLK